MKKVLVVGSNSYIGRKFREYILQMDKEGISADLVSALDGSWRQADFSSYDAVLHLAAMVHIKETKDMEMLYYRINHELAVEVAEKAKENHVKQFIFMSTASVYGLRTGCIDKETVPKPTTFYGKSKLAAEMDIMKLQDEDFRIAIVRPPMVYGEGCKGNYARLVKLAKFTPVFPEYHNKRSILHIKHLSELLAELIRNESSGYFHPQDDEYADTCELIVKIRKNMGKKTILISCFNIIINFLIKNHINIFQKMFGDFYYDITL